jgi:TRAP transporter 4TM/12TM fusion protein
MMKQGEVVNSKALDMTVLILSVGIMLYLVSYALLIWESPNRLVLIFIPFVLILWSVRRMRDGTLFGLRGKWSLLLGFLFIALLAYSAYYFYSEYHLLLFERAADNNLTDMVLGMMLLVSVVLVTWQEMGSPIPLVLMVFVAYAFLGKYLPADSILSHAGISFSAFMRFSVLSPDGIFGTLPIAGFTLVMIFLFFAGVVRGFGGLTYIINFSRRITRRFSWGLPQIPVISSLMFGSFSGAAAANVAGTGSFTIPMMKRFGVSSKVAAAIESVASSGGQIVPPVMGVAAFLMADFLGIPYLRVVVIGLVPALVFYLCAAFAVYLITQDLPISNLPRAQREELDEDFHLSDGLPLAVAILVLLFFLAYFRSSVLVSGMWMLIGYFAMQLLFYLLRANFSPSSLRKFFRDTADGIRSGGASVVGIITLLATMGVIAKMLAVTGLSQDLSFLMVDLSGGNILLLLPLIFIICILMGMAVSTLVVYIMVVLLAAPALMEYGVAPHVAHFTVFYLALLSGITPPVAISVAVACGIANSSFFGTAWVAMKIGLPLFLLPFVFLFKPAILAANLTTTPLAFLQILVGFLAITYGIHSKSKGTTDIMIRFLFGGLGAIGVFSPTPSISWLCLVAVAVLAILYSLMRRMKGAKGLA